MKYIHMLPFLDDEDLDELIEKILSGEVKGIKMMMLYPFISEESLEKLVNHLIDENKSKDLVHALPFISKKKINDIYDKVQDGTLTGISEMSIMPFLGKSKIKEVFKSFVKNATEFGVDEEDDVEDEEE